MNSCCYISLEQIKYFFSGYRRENESERLSIMAVSTKVLGHLQQTRTYDASNPVECVSIPGVSAECSVVSVLTLT